MSLFELVRVWDAWPAMAGSQALRRLFREAPARAGPEQGPRVFMTSSHLFVATQGEEGQPELLWLDCSPSSPDSGWPQAKGGISEAGQLPLEPGGGDVVGVSCVRGEEVWVSRGGGDLEMSILEGGQWRRKGCTRLSGLRGLVECVVHCSSQHVVYCEGPASDHTHSCQVCVRRYELEAGAVFGAAQAVLTSCPHMSLWPWSGGVAFSPTTGPTPPGLLLFWLPHPPSLKTYICNHRHPLPSRVLSSHYPSLVLRLAPLWAQCEEEGAGPQLISMAVHPLTHQLLLLLSSGEVWGVFITPSTPSTPSQLSARTTPSTLSTPSQLSARTTPSTLSTPSQLSACTTPSTSSTPSQLSARRLLQLSDFSYRYRLATPLLGPTRPSSPYPYPSPSSSSPSSSSLTLFAVHTYYGVYHQGEIRLYDGFSGEFVWESEEHAGSLGQRLLCTPSSYPSSPSSPSSYPSFLHCPVLLNSTAIWFLRSRRLLDHASLLAHALFPITTNADETTPGDYLDEGRVLAAQLCRLWGLELPAIFHALEAAHGTVEQDRVEENGEREDELFLPNLSDELLSMLGNGAMQNPALLVALLSEHPSYQHVVRDVLSLFLTSYSGDGQPAAGTPLNAEVVSLLKQYHSLSESYQAQLSHWLDQRCLLPSDRAAVGRLLASLEGDLLPPSLPPCLPPLLPPSLRAQLLLTAHRSPRQTLDGLKDFLHIHTFREAVEQLRCGAWHSERNWKMILGAEFGASLGQGLVQPHPPNLPLFELMCRLLYLLEPEEVIHFVRFAQLARDYQAAGDSAFARKCRETYFFHRALESLPEVVTSDLTPCSRETLVCRSQLLLHSERSGKMVSAMQLLLGGQLWSEAIQLLSNTHHTTTHCALFHLVLTSMVKAGVLHCYMPTVWTLRPHTFSVFDFLNILKASLPATAGTSVWSQDTPCLMIKHIKPGMEELINPGMEELINLGR